MSKRTIAIIGATGKMGLDLSKNLAQAGYRLLLFDHNETKLTVLAGEIKKLSPSADIDYMNCAANASWEADVIIPNIVAAHQKELAEKIKPFTNRKIVISFSDENLQELLPGATVVKVFGTNETAKANKDLLMNSDNEEAIQITSEILKDAGFVPVALKKLNSKQSKINTMETTKWIIDSTHSEIHFKVKHLMVSWVTGNFKTFDATVETEGEDISTAKIHFTADIHSISTNNEQRDAHLRTGDFFDAENHPQLVFESNRLEKAGDENYKLFGTLTMRGTSKPVTLNVEFGGITKDPWGNTRAGFSVSGKINRKDFGVSFSMVSETGGILLGEDVSINANVEFVKQVATESKAA
jgi:polyisoprenoid-binding protein YceI